MTAKEALGEPVESLTKGQPAELLDQLETERQPERHSRLRNG